MRYDHSSTMLYLGQTHVSIEQRHQRSVEVIGYEHTGAPWQYPPSELERWVLLTDDQTCVAYVPRAELEGQL